MHLRVGSFGLSQIWVLLGSSAASASGRSHEEQCWSGEKRGYWGVGKSGLESNQHKEVWRELACFTRPNRVQVVGPEAGCDGKAGFNYGATISSAGSYVNHATTPPVIRSSVTEPKLLNGFVEEQPSAGRFTTSPPGAGIEPPATPQRKQRFSSETGSSDEEWGAHKQEQKWVENFAC